MRTAWLGPEPILFPYKWQSSQGGKDEFAEKTLNRKERKEARRKEHREMKKRNIKDSMAAEVHPIDCLRLAAISFAIVSLSVSDKILVARGNSDSSSTLMWRWYIAARASTFSRN